MDWVGFEPTTSAMQDCRYSKKTSPTERRESTIPPLIFCYQYLSLRLFVQKGFDCYGCPSSVFKLTCPTSTADVRGAELKFRLLFLFEELY